MNSSVVLLNLLRIALGNSAEWKVKLARMAVPI